VCTEEEFDSYVWPKGVDGKPVKEEPVKEHDHGLDALRYLVASLAVPPTRFYFNGESL
jgi:phage terminase large subunit